MKKKIIQLLLLSLATFIVCSTTHAQLSIKTERASSRGAVDIVTLNNTSAGVINLFVMDSLSDYNHGEARHQIAAIAHLASFEIELGNVANTSLLQTLYSSMQGQPLPALTLQKLSADFRSIEERNYSQVVVKEIIFPEFNTSLREVPKVKISVTAQDILHNNGSGNRISSFQSDRSKQAFSNMFRLDMDGMPTQKVTRFGKIHISNMAPKTSSNQYFYFSIDIASEDAVQWYNWLNASAGGGGQHRQGTLSLLDNTMQQFFSIQLSQVEIVSISTQSEANSIPKTTIGLRTNQPLVIN